MFTPDVVWSLILCGICIILLIHGDRSMKKLLLIGALLLITCANVRGTI